MNRNCLLQVVLLIAAGSTLHGQTIPAGGGQIATHAKSSDCITPAERTLIDRLVTEYQAARGSLSGWAGTPAPMEFYPQGGTQYEDLWTSNYVDLNTSSGTLDWNCWSYTYDGHDASDSLIRSFGQQLLGVPVFAAQAGVVVSAADGNTDMNVVWAGQPANFVLIDHGGGRIGYYWHLKNGSVAVSAGQSVVAGQQLGLTASSGNSNYPHLHFGLYDNGSVTEPYTGPCHPGPSGWVDQPALVTTPFVWDFGFSRVDLAPYAPPFEFPHTGQLAFSDPFIRHWVLLPSLPAFSTWRVVYKRPNGTAAFDSGTNGFGTSVHYNFSWWWWSYDIPEMHTLAGTWRLELSINGVLLVNAPIEVVASFNPLFNRAPQPITAQLLPLHPEPGDMLRAEVTSDPVLDDLDYDIVRHRWIWSVDGSVVRDVTTAARADLLPAVSNGGLVTCRVTPSDGTTTGAPVDLQVAVQGPAFSNLGQGLAGNAGIPVSVGEGTLAPLSQVRLLLADAAPGAAAGLLVGATTLNTPFKGGVLVPDPSPPGLFIGLATSASGDVLIDTFWPSGLPTGTSIFFQWWIKDAGGPSGLAASPALQGVTP